MNDYPSRHLCSEQDGHHDHANLLHWIPPCPEPPAGPHTVTPPCAFQHRRKLLHPLPRNLLGIFFPCHHIFSPAQTPTCSITQALRKVLGHPLSPAAAPAAVSTQLHHSLASSPCTPQGAATTHHAGDKDQNPSKDQQPTQDPSIPPLCCQTPAPLGFLLSPTLLVNPLQALHIVPSPSGIISVPSPAILSHFQCARLEIQPRYL